MSTKAPFVALLLSFAPQLTPIKSFAPPMLMLGRISNEPEGDTSVAGSMGGGGAGSMTGGGSSFSHAALMVSRDGPHGSWTGSESGGSVLGVGNVGETGIGCLAGSGVGLTAAAARGSLADCRCNPSAAKTITTAPIRIPIIPSFTRRSSTQVAGSVESRYTAARLFGQYPSLLRDW